MKPLPAIFLISFGAACTTTAADYPVPSALASATEANSESYFITERGPYHKVWERLEKQTNHLGRVTTRKHSYTELADGMHYIDAAGN